TYRVRQVLPTGWLQTTTNPADLTASSGSNVAGINFGAFQQISISGLLFQDSNGDGVRERNNPRLTSWHVDMDANDNAPLDTSEATATTDSHAPSLHDALPICTYRVRQVLPTGWLQTTSNPTDLSASSGSNVAGINFGAFQQISISGVLFQDNNGDGV